MTHRIFLFRVVATSQSLSPWVALQIGLPQAGKRLFGINVVQLHILEHTYRFICLSLRKNTVEHGMWDWVPKTAGNGKQLAAMITLNDGLLELTKNQRD